MKFRIFKFLVWYGAPVLFAVMTLVGATTLIGGAETEPTVVDIADLEAGKQPSAEWLQIENGVLVWGASAKRTVGSRAEVKTWEVPVVSEAHCHEALASAFSKPSAGVGLAVILRLDKAEVETLNPKVLSDPDDAPIVTRGDRLRGLVRSHSPIGDDVKKLLADEVAWDFSRTVYLDAEDAPLQRGGAAVIFLLGVGGIWGWNRLRKSKRAKASTAPVAGGHLTPELHAAIMAGFEKGLQDGVRSGVTDGLRAARAVHGVGSDQHKPG
jgi:hypothetical protein